MKILLTGASGLLGRVLSVELGRLEKIQLIELAFAHASDAQVSLDLMNTAALVRALEEWRPDLIIHAAAERHPDIVDKDPVAAKKLNVDATAALANFAAAQQAAFIYLSTDYVFDGTMPPYKSEDTPHPLNEYGRLKFEGEVKVKAAFGTSAFTKKAAIFRVPLLYGPIKNFTELSITEALPSLLEGNSVLTDAWAMRYPLHVADISAAILLIISQLAIGEGGIYQLSGSEGFTKYEMLRIAAEALGLDASKVVANSHPPKGTPRPRDCRLDSSRLGQLGFTPQILFREGIKKALDPFSR